MLQVMFKYCTLASSTSVMTIKKRALRFEIILLSLICVALTPLTTCSSVFEANGQIPQGSHFNKLLTFSLQNAKALGKSDPRYFMLIC
jgi:hypothetical protein